VGGQGTGVFSLRVKTILPADSENPAQVEDGQNTIIFGADNDSDANPNDTFDDWLDTLGDTNPAAPGSVVRFYEHEVDDLNDIVESNDFAGDDDGDPNNDASTAVFSDWTMDLGFSDPGEESSLDDKGDDDPGNDEIVSNNGEGWVASGPLDSDLFGANNQGLGLFSLAQTSDGAVDNSLLPRALAQQFAVEDVLTEQAQTWLGTVDGQETRWWGQSQITGTSGDFQDAGWDLGNTAKVNGVVVPTPTAAGGAFLMLGLLGSMQTFKRRRSERASA
jgi:hypothetical protein